MNGKYREVKEQVNLNNEFFSRCKGMGLIEGIKLMKDLFNNKHILIGDSLIEQVIEEKEFLMNNQENIYVDSDDFNFLENDGIYEKIVSIGYELVGISKANDLHKIDIRVFEFRKK